VLREYTETILVCILFVVFMRSFVVQQSEIPSASMEDTILVGDYILVNRFLYAPTSFDWERSLLPRREIRRGDIVVFKMPETPEVDYIKRVVGLPGDSVAWTGGTLYVNGIPVHEPYVGPLYRSPERPQQPVVIEPEHYFLMGDHRNRSSDSRVFGPVPAALIKGRAFLILFSTSAAPPPGQPPGQVTLGSLGRKLYNLAFHSRWDRCLRPIR
jgi:signal peptidase I